MFKYTVIRCGICGKRVPVSIPPSILEKPEVKKSLLETGLTPPIEIRHAEDHTMLLVLDKRMFVRDVQFGITVKPGTGVVGGVELVKLPCGQLKNIEWMELEVKKANRVYLAGKREHAENVSTERSGISVKGFATCIYPSEWYEVYTGPSKTAYVKEWMEILAEAIAKTDPANPSLLARAVEVMDERVFQRPGENDRERLEVLLKLDKLKLELSGKVPRSVMEEIRTAMPDVDLELLLSDPFVYVSRITGVRAEKLVSALILLEVLGFVGFGEGS